MLDSTPSRPVQPPVPDVMQVAPAQPAPRRLQDWSRFFPVQPARHSMPNELQSALAQSALQQGPQSDLAQPLPVPATQSTQPAIVIESEKPQFSWQQLQSFCCGVPIDKSEQPKFSWQQLQSFCCGVPIDKSEHPKSTSWRQLQSFCCGVPIDDESEQAQSSRQLQSYNCCGIPVTS